MFMPQTVTTKTSEGRGTVVGIVSLVLLVASAVVLNASRERAIGRDCQQVISWVRTSHSAHGAYPDLTLPAEFQGLSYCPRAICRLSGGSTALRLPLRNPSRSSDTYLKPSDLSLPTTCAAELRVGKLRQRLRRHLDPRHVALMITHPQRLEALACARTLRLVDHRQPLGRDRLAVGDAAAQAGRGRLVPGGQVPGGGQLRESRPWSGRTRPAGCGPARSPAARRPGRCSPWSSRLEPSATTATPSRAASLLHLAGTTRVLQK